MKIGDRVVVKYPDINVTPYYSWWDEQAGWKGTIIAKWDDTSWSVATDANGGHWYPEVYIKLLNTQLTFQFGPEHV